MVSEKLKPVKQQKNYEENMKGPAVFWVQNKSRRRKGNKRKKSIEVGQNIKDLKKHLKDKEYEKSARRKSILEKIKLDIAKEREKIPFQVRSEDKISILLEESAKIAR